MMKACSLASVALLIAAAAALLIAPGAAAAQPALQVGSKRFTESYILGEIVAQTARASGAAARHQPGLGNTAIVLAALRSGRIDVYPEYTGTIAREILRLDHVPALAQLDSLLAADGLRVAVPLGFDNSYALAMRADDARARGISRLSDLAAHPDLRLGLSQEFLGRADGWPGLRSVYSLPFESPRGLDHGLAYEALAQGQVDVVDVYTTDAKIDRYQLVVLQDDRDYFPRYDAVLLHRADLPQRLPRTWSALERLAARIDAATMRRLNAQAELDGRSFEQVAADFLTGLGAAGPSTAASDRPEVQQRRAAGRSPFIERLLAPDLGRLALEHVALVFVSLLASIAIGVPLGVLAARMPSTEAAVIGAVGIIQTVPALALLAFLIPLTGRIGAVPAVIALALYALLPIVRNTHAGLTQVPAGLTQAGRSLGMPPSLVLRRIELPLAAATIFAGIKTSAVINVGTATIAAFIGAGGFGERIVTGLALNDHAMLLAGAVPAAALALAIERLFAAGERGLTPPPLRPQRGRSRTATGSA